MKKKEREYRDETLEWKKSIQLRLLLLTVTAVAGLWNHSKIIVIKKLPYHQIALTCKNDGLQFYATAYYTSSYVSFRSMSEIYWQNVKQFIYYELVGRTMSSGKQRKQKFISKPYKRSLNSLDSLKPLLSYIHCVQCHPWIKLYNLRFCSG